MALFSGEVFTLVFNAWCKWASAHIYTHIQFLTHCTHWAYLNMGANNFDLFIFPPFDLVPLSVYSCQLWTGHRHFWCLFALSDNFQCCKEHKWKKEDESIEWSNDDDGDDDNDDDNKAIKNTSNTMCKISFDQNYGINIIAVTWQDITKSTPYENATLSLSWKERWQKRKQKKNSIVIQRDLNYILSISSRTSHSVCRFSIEWKVMKAPQNHHHRCLTSKW